MTTETLRSRDIVHLSTRQATLSWAILELHLAYFFLSIPKKIGYHLSGPGGWKRRRITYVVYSATPFVQCLFQPFEIAHMLRNYSKQCAHLNGILVYQQSSFMENNTINIWKNHILTGVTHPLANLWVHVGTSCDTVEYYIPHDMRRSVSPPY